MMVRVVMLVQNITQCEPLTARSQEPLLSPEAGETSAEREPGSPNVLSR